MKSPPSYQESVKKKEQLLGNGHQNDFMYGSNASYDHNGKSDLMFSRGGLENGGGKSGLPYPYNNGQSENGGGENGEQRPRYGLAKSPSPSVASLKQQLQQQSNKPISRSHDQNDVTNNYFSLNRYSFDKSSNGVASPSASPLTLPNGGAERSQSQSTSNMNRFTNEIERELTNLTLKIEKDLESQHQMHKNKPKPAPPLPTSSYGDYANSNGLLGNGGHKSSYGQCCECMKEIQTRTDACLAMGNLYHSDCFICASCGRTLRDKSFYHINNKNYCEEDYLYSGFLQNAEKCSICGHIIVDMILQACGKSYHPGCFRCSVCNESLDGLPFTLDINNKIYCIQDYYKKYAPKCHGCGHLITPAEGSNETVRVVSMEKDFHVECYVCRDCGTQLTDENEKRCYPLDNCLLCLSCHLGRLGSSSSTGSSNSQSSKKPPKHSNGGPSMNGSYYSSGVGGGYGESSFNESKSSFAYPSQSSQGAPPPPPPPSYYQPPSHLQKQSINGYY